MGGGDALHIEVVGRGGGQSWGVSAAPPPRPPSESVGQPEEASPEEQQEEACAEEANGGEERPEDDGEGEAAYLDELPEPLLLRVLAELPAAQLVQACRLVCLRWKELVDGAPLWLLKCQQEGLVPQDGPEDERDHWQQFYFLSTASPAEGLPPPHLLPPLARGHLSSLSTSVDLAPTASLSLYPVPTPVQDQKLQV